MSAACSEVAGIVEGDARSFRFRWVCLPCALASLVSGG